MQKQRKKTTQKKQGNIKINFWIDSINFIHQGDNIGSQIWEILIYVCFEEHLWWIVSSLLSHTHGYHKATPFISEPKRVVGTQKNRLNEMVLLITHNICLNRGTRRYSQYFVYGMLTNIQCHFSCYMLIEECCNHRLTAKLPKLSPIQLTWIVLGRIMLNSKKGNWIWKLWMCHHRFR